MENTYLEKSFEERYDMIKHAVVTYQFNPATDFIFYELLENKNITPKERGRLVKQLTELIIRDGRYIEDGISICNLYLSNKNLNSKNEQSLARKVLRLIENKSYFSVRKETISLIKKCLEDKTLSNLYKNTFKDYLINSLAYGRREERNEAISITRKALNEGNLDAKHKNKFLLKLVHLASKNYKKDRDNDYNKNFYSDILKLVERYYYDKDIIDGVKRHINKLVLSVVSEFDLETSIKPMGKNIKVSFNEHGTTTNNDTVLALFKQLEEGHSIDSELKKLLETMTDYRLQALMLYNKSKQTPLKNKDITAEDKENLPSSLINSLKLGNRKKSSIIKESELKDFLNITSNLIDADEDSNPKATHKV